MNSVLLSSPQPSPSLLLLPPPWSQWSGRCVAGLPRVALDVTQSPTEHDDEWEPMCPRDEQHGKVARSLGLIRRRCILEEDRSRCPHRIRRARAWVVTFMVHSFNLCEWPMATTRKIRICSSQDTINNAYDQELGTWWPSGPDHWVMLILSSL